MSRFPYHIKEWAAEPKLCRPFYPIRLLGRGILVGCGRNGLLIGALGDGVTRRLGDTGAFDAGARPRLEHGDGLGRLPGALGLLSDVHTGGLVDTLSGAPSLS